MNTPRVSVIMSVYNAEEYLKEAIDSILGQTYKNFEFIIINDGSVDESKNIIKSYNDPRIRLINRSNKGLTYSLNQGLGMAKGEYIARMDADDVSASHRFEREVEYLDKHPSVGLVGSNYTIIDEAGKPLVTTNVFTHPEDLKTALICSNQYGHGSIMMRAAILDKVKGYDSSVGHVEDYDLWVRISHFAEVANIREPLYLWRKVPESITHSNGDLQLEQAYAVRDREFKYYLAHKKEYRLLAFHPNGASNYWGRKSAYLRDMAYLSRTHSLRVKAFSLMIAALLVDPKNKRNYKRLLLILWRPLFNKHWTYEYL